LIWYLETRSTESRLTTRSPVSPMPFRVGRRWDLELVLPSPMISWEHAEITENGGVLHVHDLKSTNGTSVNGRRVTGATQLAEGDVLHFALLEYRLGRAVSPSELLQSTANLPAVPPQLAQQAVQLAELMQNRSVQILFQPIVRLQGEGTVGFEILGRGAHDRLPSGPADLLEIANRLGAAAELSRLFRVRGLEEARKLPTASRLFANTHPAELHQPGHLFRSLDDLRRQAPDRKLALEVHEKGITSLASLQALRTRLHSLDIQLAYDDFGAGQARLLELGEVPPDVLKVDGALIRGVEQAPASRHSVLASMLRIASDLGIETVAEGVETAGALETCRQLGFHSAQGYFCGIPAPAARYLLSEDRLDDTAVAF
jgi:EAL domain-containing protein (putative c-di-GMP-specific phosphodiesterase class I)